ncbi:MAG TPA: Os1348 family NHLP clan protein [Chloroflexota bacterium]|nr:Os1348 family NHLP clan protein [Chloroflexota bacterium]
MSQEALSKVIERASTDAAFRAQLANSPESALAGYDLTPEERAAVMNGDSGTMSSLGVDARVSKLDNPAMPGDAFPQGPFAGGTGG